MKLHSTRVTRNYSLCEKEQIIYPMKLPGDFSILWASDSSCLYRHFKSSRALFVELLTISLYTNRKVFPGYRPLHGKRIGKNTDFTWAQLLQPAHHLLQVFKNHRKQAGKGLPRVSCPAHRGSAVPISFLTGDKRICSDGIFPCN